MSTDLTALIQEAFSECYALDEVARLYFDIRIECEKQLEYKSIEIVKEIQENGVIKMSETNGKIKTSEIMIIVGGSVDKPYYSIRYYDLSDNEWHIGFSSYYLQNVINWKNEYFEIVEPIEHVEPTKAMGIERKWECEYNNLKAELECAHKDIKQMRMEIGNKNVAIEHLQDVNEGLSLEIEACKGKVQAFEYCFKCLGGKEQ